MQITKFLLPSILYTNFLAEIKAIKLGAINSDTYAIDVDDLSNGMYFLTCKFEKGGVMTQKFVIRK